MDYAPHSFEVAVYWDCFFGALQTTDTGLKRAADVDDLVFAQKMFQANVTHCALKTQTHKKNDRTAHADDFEQ